MGKYFWFALFFLGIFFSSPAHGSMVSSTPVITSWPLLKAYPGIEYNIRLGVVGGKFPYSFSLTTAPSGMAISNNGTITWTPDAGLAGQSFNVVAKVTDGLGQIVNQSYSLSVTTTGFYFVSPSGNDSNPGTISQPWLTINKGLSSGTNSDYLYVRAGTYNQAWSFQAGKINRLIAYPGESPIIDFQLQNGPGFADNRTYIDGFEIRNATYRMFDISAGMEELVWRRNIMHDLWDTSDTGNPAFIFTWDNDPYMTTKSIIQDNRFYNLFDRASGVNGDTTPNYHGGSIVLYNTSWTLYENNVASDIDGPCAKDKDHGIYNTYRGNTLWNCNSNNGEGGISVSAQHGSEFIDINHNIVPWGISLGTQGDSYMRNVEVKNNTLYKGFLVYSWSMANAGSGNISVLDNIFSHIPSNELVYGLQPGTETNALGANGGPMNYNIINSANSIISGPWNGGIASRTLADIRSTFGKEINSITSDPQYTSINANPTLGNWMPASGSPACTASSTGSYVGAVPCAGAPPSDTTPPSLSVPSSIGTTKNKTPSFSFTSDEAGTITYGGSCSSATTTATTGNNTIALNNLNIGTYSNCTITVTDSSSNVSTPLMIPTFHITYPGDLDLNRNVNIFDYNILLTNFGQTNCGNSADIDGNCSVNIFDYNALIGDFGNSF